MYLNSRDMSMSNNAMVWLLKWGLFKQLFFMECVWKVAINLFTLTLEQKGKRVGTKKMFQAKWLRIYWLVDTGRPQIVIRWFCQSYICEKSGLWSFKTCFRDLHIECSKQFKWNWYFYVSGQSGLFWGSAKTALKFKCEI